MSSYLVEDRVINVIVSHLHVNRELEWLRAEFCDVVKPMTKDVDAEIGSALHAMNCAALAARYGDKEFPRYQFRLEPATPREVYACAKNLQYQCSEGDVPETPLFKLLVSLRAAVADEVIESLPDEKQTCAFAEEDRMTKLGAVSPRRKEENNVQEVFIHSER